MREAIITVGGFDNASGNNLNVNELKPLVSGESNAHFSVQ